MKNPYLYYPEYGEVRFKESVLNALEGFAVRVLNEKPSNRNPRKTQHPYFFRESLNQVAEYFTNPPSSDSIKSRRGRPENTLEILHFQHVAEAWKALGGKDTTSSNIDGSSSERLGPFVRFYALIHDLLHASPLLYETLQKIPENEWESTFSKMYKGNVSISQQLQNTKRSYLRHYFS